MKLTSRQLKNIIKEEVSKVLSEGADADALIDSINSKLAESDLNALSGAAAVALRFMLHGKVPAEVADTVIRTLPGLPENDLATIIDGALVENPPVAVLQQIDMMLGDTY